MEREIPRGRSSNPERRVFALGGLGLLLTAVFLAKAHVFQVDRQYRSDPVAGIAVNVNTADTETLSLLRHIGPERARRIVQHREQHGPFRSYPDLMRVSGIGRKTVEEIIGQVSFALPD